MSSHIDYFSLGYCMEETVLMKYKFLDGVSPKEEKAFREEMCWFFNPCTKRIIRHYHLQNWNKWTGQKSIPDMPGKYTIRPVPCTGLLAFIEFLTGHHIICLQM